jgi:hypothetical protein
MVLKKATSFFAAPILLLISTNQVSFAANEPELKTKLLEYSEPSVVRVLTGCFGRYSYFPTNSQPSDDKTILVMSKYSKDSETTGFALGTGYFVNPSGYLTTSLELGQFSDNFSTKSKCKEHLIGRIINDSSEIKEYIEKNGKEEERKRIEGALLNGEEFSLSNGKTIKFKDKDIEHHRHIIFGREERKDSTYKESITQNGKEVALIKVDIANAPSLQLGDSEQVKVLDDVWILSYPPDADLYDTEKLKLLKKAQSPDDIFKLVNTLFDKSKKPAVTFSKKSISGIRTLESGAKILQMSEQVQEGMYGSPILNSRGEVIGTVNRVGPGYTYAVPANTMKQELLANVTPNMQGETYDKYRNGLDAFWKGECPNAITSLKEVKNLFPPHLTVDAKLQEIEIQCSKPNPLPWFALIAASLLGLSVIAYFLVPKAFRPKTVSGSASGSSSSHRPQTPRSKPDSSGTGVIQSSFIELSYQNQKVLRFYLGENEYRLGRDSEWSDFEIPDKEWKLLSSRHAILRKEGTDYRLYDGDGITPTTNGNFINGARVTPQEGHFLRHGTQVKIGADNNSILLTYYNPASSARRNAPTEYAG